MIRTPELSSVSGWFNGLIWLYPTSRWQFLYGVSFSKSLEPKPLLTSNSLFECVDLYILSKITSFRKCFVIYAPSFTPRTLYPYPWISNSPQINLRHSYPTTYFIFKLPHRCKHYLFL